jgi:hypothetical protein
MNIQMNEPHGIAIRDKKKNRNRKTNKERKRMTERKKDGNKHRQR